MVEWAGVAAVAAAAVSVKQQFEREGFDPVGFTRSAGIRSDQGLYAIA